MQQHPILILLNKKVRAARKKVDKIRALEDAIASGKLVNEQQREVLSHKYTSEKLLSEFESIHAQCQEYLKQDQAANHVSASSDASMTSTNSEKDTSGSSSSSSGSGSSMEPPVVGKENPVVVEEGLVMECKETMTETMAKTMAKTEIIGVPDPMDAVQQILEVIHVVTLHQALENPVPSPLDFFMKTLCGKSRPPAEISFDENLMESLEEAKRYLGASEKVVACEMTYAQLRETIRILVCPPPRPEAVVVASSPVVQSPQFNFFTESQLIEDDIVKDVATGPEVDAEMSDPLEPAQAPVAATSSLRKSSSRGKQYRPVSKDNPPSQTKPNPTPAGKPHHHHSKDTSATNNNPSNKQHRRPRSARQTSNNSRSSGGGKQHSTMKNSAPSTSS